MTEFNFDTNYCFSSLDNLNRECKNYTNSEAKYQELRIKYENEIYNKALEDLTELMYQKSMIEDSEMQKWDSGCWIRYKLFENCVEQLKKGK